MDYDACARFLKLSSGWSHNYLNIYEIGPKQILFWQVQISILTCKNPIVIGIL